MRFDAFADPVGDARAALAAALVGPKSEVFAVGYTDGTIALHPTTNVLPSITEGSAPGAIRAMFGTATGVVVVTRTGVIASVPVDVVGLSNRYLANEAAERLRRAKELGLVA